MDYSIQKYPIGSIVKFKEGLNLKEEAFNNTYKLTEWQYGYGSYKAKSIDAELEIIILEEDIVLVKGRC